MLWLVVTVLHFESCALEQLHRHPMADFSDLLWTDSSASKPKPANVTLGNGLANKSSTPVQNSARTATGARPYDAFSALASTASGSRGNYSRTNSSTSGVSGTFLGLPSRAAATPSPAPVAPSSSGDAFGSLFSPGNGSNANLSTLSLAQQQARLTQQKQNTPSMPLNGGADQGAFWDRLESGTSVSTAAKVQTSTTASSSGVSSPAISYTPSSLLAPSILQPTSRPGSSAAAASSASINSSSDPWGDFDALSTQNNIQNATIKAPTASRPTRASGKVTAADLFDFGDFDEQTPATLPTNDRKVPSRDSPLISRPTSPGDFDFGDREYDEEDGGGLLGGGGRGHDDEEDILGDLGRPVDELASITTSSASTVSFFLFTNFLEISRMMKGCPSSTFDTSG